MSLVGFGVGGDVGPFVGGIDGAGDGAFVGGDVGSFVGASEGCGVGAFVGDLVGADDVGSGVGAGEGCGVGECVGGFVGADVGKPKHLHSTGALVGCAIIEREVHIKRGVSS